MKVVTINVMQVILPILTENRVELSCSVQLQLFRIHSFVFRIVT